MTPLSWGELRSQLSEYLTHQHPLTLWSILELLEDTHEHEQGLSYIHDHLAHGQDGPRQLERFEQLRADAPHLRELCEQAHQNPGRVDQLLWFLLNNAQPPLASEIAQLLLERLRAQAPLVLEHHEHELELALMVRFIVDGEPALGELITKHHQCDPGLWRQFLCAWAWSVVESPTSSPSLSLDGRASEVWQVKAWPRDYDDGGVITSEGWQIVVDEDDSETLFRVDLSDWPGIDGLDVGEEDDD